MMKGKVLCLLAVSVLVAYYIYSPVPEDVEDYWKVMLVNALSKTLDYGGTIAEKLGIAHYMDVVNIFTKIEYTAAESDEKVNVTDTEFDHVPVRLYIPKGQSDHLKRAVIFLHGGGWCIGSGEMKTYDLLSRWTSERLHAVVVSVSYRLAPKYHFPVQFEDVYAVAKYFLQRSVLEKYNIDPSRVCISGDSAGGNIAAAVTQQLLDDLDDKVKLKIQVLLYPALQTVDLDLPSYQDNENMPILSKSLMLRFWSEYITTDLSLLKALQTNQHFPEELNHLFQFVNWSIWLPERFREGHIYTCPSHGHSQVVKKYLGLFDPRASPLLVNDIKLQGLPLTYIVTNQYDILRDDGIIYVSRLRKAGVPVVHEHIENGVHGVLTFLSAPFSLTSGWRLANRYIEWLDENL